MRKGLLLLILSLLPAIAVDGAPVTDEVVAWVGDKAITRGMVEDFISWPIGPHAWLHAGPSPEARRSDRLRAEALKELIARELLVAEARRLGIDISNDELNNDLRRSAKRAARSVARNDEDRARRETLEGFRLAIERAGASFTRVKELRRDVLLERRYRGWKSSQIMPVSPREIRRHYEQNRQMYRGEQKVMVRAMVRMVGDDSDRELWKRIEREMKHYHAAITAGDMTLEAVAGSNSETGSADREQGGLICDAYGKPQMCSPEDLPDEVREVALNLPEKQLSPVVYCLPSNDSRGKYNPAQFWIFSIEKRQFGRKLSFEEIQPRIWEELNSLAARKAVDKEVARLWKGSYVWVHPSIEGVEPPGAERASGEPEKESER